MSIIKEALEIQDGRVIDYTLAGSVNVGDVIPLGSSMVGIAVISGLAGEVISVDTEKVWQVTAKTSEAIAVGDILYFDVTNRELTKTSTGNVKAGKAMTSKSAVAGTINIKINI